MNIPLLSALVVALACGPASALGLVRVSATRVGPQHIASGVVPRGLSLNAGKPGLLPQSFGGTPLLQVAPELRQGLALNAHANVSALGVDLVHAGPATSVAARLKNTSFALADAQKDLGQDKSSDGLHQTGTKLEQVLTGETQAYRPAVEWWTVGTQRFDSTQALLASGVADKGAVAAVHHHRASAGRVGFLRPLTAVLGGTASAALGGGAIGALFSSNKDLWTEYFKLTDDFLFGTAAMAITLGALGLTLALDRSVGYAIGGYMKTGTLVKKDGALLFEGHDLARHASAPVLERRAVPGTSRAFFRGALWSAGLVVSSVLFPIGVFVTPFMGGYLASRLAPGRGLLGGLAGWSGAALALAGTVALGVAVSLFSWAVVWPWLLAAVGAGSALAFALSPLARSSDDYAARSANSWWQVPS